VFGIMEWMWWALVGSFMSSYLLSFYSSYLVAYLMVACGALLGEPLKGVRKRQSQVWWCLVAWEVVADEKGVEIDLYYLPRRMYILIWMLFKHKFRLQWRAINICSSNIMSELESSSEIRRGRQVSNAVRGFPAIRRIEIVRMPIRHGHGHPAPHQSPAPFP
jgi:hypothetical protein